MPTKGWHEWEALLFFHQSQELECRSTAKLHSMLKGERLLPHIRMTTIGVGQASFLLHQFTRLCINIGPLGFFLFLSLWWMFCVMSVVGGIGCLPETYMRLLHILSNYITLSSKPRPNTLVIYIQEECCVEQVEGVNFFGLIFTKFSFAKEVVGICCNNLVFWRYKNIIGERKHMSDTCLISGPLHLIS